MSFRIRTPLAAIALAVFAVAAQAGPHSHVDTVDFDALSRTLLGRDLGHTYTEDGFKFTSPGMLRDPSVFTSADWHGETLSDPTGAKLTVARTDGSDFDLLSFQLADFLDVGYRSKITMSWVDDTGSHTQTLRLDKYPGLQTFTFNYDDVQSFSLWGDGFQIDNLRTTLSNDCTGQDPSTSTVPEPGSMTLLLAGFAVLGVKARRRKA